MAHRQPAHRRPSWAQRDRSYEHYLRRDLAINRFPGRDYGTESFSYDELHLAKWRMPAPLAAQIPVVLRSPVAEWQYAGAAVCTALDRIARLARDALHRAYPDKSAQRHLIRESSSSSSAGQMEGAETNMQCLSPDGAHTMSRPDAPACISPAASAVTSPMDVFSARNVSHRLEMLSLSPLMLNPPTSPTLPDEPLSLASDTAPLTTATAHVAPLLSPTRTESDCSPTSTPSPTSSDPPSLTSSTYPLPTGSPSFSPRRRSDPASCVFDENAWETYLNSFGAELTDLRSLAWARFNGLRHAVVKARLECKFARDSSPDAFCHGHGIHTDTHEGVRYPTNDLCTYDMSEAHAHHRRDSASPQTRGMSVKDVLEEFDAWWKGMLEQMADLEASVRAAKAPALARVMKERASEGLPV